MIRRFTAAAAVVAATLLLPPPAMASTAAGSPVTASAVARVTSAAASCPSPGGVGVRRAPMTTSGALVVNGHGWGHSLGLSQYGAQGAARLGCSAATILATYYRGTTLERRDVRPSVTLRLLSAEPAGRSTVTAQGGPLTWVAVSADQTVEQPAGTTWTVRRRADLSGIVLIDELGTERFWVAHGGRLVVRERGSVARVRSFGGTRGTTVRTDLRLRWDDTEFTSSTRGLSALQVLRDDATGSAVQKYLWGLAEVPASWPAAALQAQAIAARTYLVAGYANPTDSSSYRIGTTSATQHYGGYRHEAQDQAAGGAWKAAVDATDRMLVIGPEGRPINAFYTSSHGGRSEDVRYVWRSAAVSYLKPLDDSRWDTASDNPYRSWAVGRSQADVARRFAMDTVSDVRVAPATTAGRLDGVTVTGMRRGVRVVRTLSGSAARTALGVRSPSFTVRWVRPQNSQPLAGDFDGDGRGDVGWFGSGRVTLLTATGTRYAYLLGRTGDRAVVGDWDGDGRDSVAVVTGDLWCLRNARSTGPCDVRFRYGRSTDTPVAGSWRGGAVDGIGVWRAGRWLLRHTPTSGAPEVDMVWGRSTDVPVVGDWNGDGVATHGVVRAGRWFVADQLVSRTPHTLTYTHGTAADRFVAGAWAGDGVSYPATVTGPVFSMRSAESSGLRTGRVVLAP